MLVWFLNYVIKRGVDSIWKKRLVKIYYGCDLGVFLIEVCGENDKDFIVKVEIKVF